MRRFILTTLIIAVPLSFIFFVLRYGEKEETNFIEETRRLTFDTYIVPVKKLDSIQFFYEDETGQKFQTINRLKSWLEDQGKTLLFATNGGIFSTSSEPLGLYIEEGKTLFDLNTSTGAGNFYLETNGVFFIKNGQANILPTAVEKNFVSSTYAVQSGPLLLEEREINPIFNKYSQNKYIRSGVCVTTKNVVVFAISNQPITFYEFASYLLNTHDCVNALYLDGFISEMYIPGTRAQTHQNFATMIGVVD